MGMTLQYFPPSLHLVPFCQLCTPQNPLKVCYVIHTHQMNTALSIALSSLPHKKKVHTQDYPPHCLHNPPMHTTNTRHSWQNGTRCRDGGRNVVSFPSSLVGLCGFHPYMGLFSFRKLFCDFVWLQVSLFSCLALIYMISVCPWIYAVYVRLHFLYIPLSV